MASWMRVWTKWLPGKLKHRIFLAFVICIVVPFALLQMYQFWKIERLMELSISRMNQSYLEQLDKAFENLKTNVLMAMLTLEKDKNIESILRSPDRYEELQRKSVVEGRFNVMQSFVPASNYVYFAMLDNYGNMYTSFGQESPGSYDEIARERGFADLEQSGASYQWLLDHTKRPPAGATALSLYSLSKGADGSYYGKMRISINYQEWFQASVKEFSSGQNYFIVSGAGETIASSRTGARLAQDMEQLMAAGSSGDYYIDRSTASIVNIRPISSTDWYLVSQFPLDMFFGDLPAVRGQITLTLVLITIAFTVISFGISSSVTRPLRQLQKKMTEMAKRNLKIRLPEDRHKGEILELHQAFNRMVGDIDQLVHQLKIEERQKEAVHFQMLLSQMNPHFLLNTLNTVKWIALDQRNESIYEICVSLGKLLETSLNPDVELIHLQEEIKLVSAYVLIQKYRYGDRFEMHCDAEPGTEFALVPKLSLQPLVENAIRHGFAEMEQGGVVAIRIYASGDKLVMEVADNGAGMEASGSTSTTGERKGIGMSNLRERLRLLYKDDARFELLPVPQGTRIRMTFPLFVAKPYV